MKYEIRNLAGEIIFNGDFLCNADLRRADLQYANLRRADLQYANLRRADLWGADLTDTILEGLKL